MPQVQSKPHQGPPVESRARSPLRPAERRDTLDGAASGHVPPLRDEDIRRLAQASMISREACTLQVLEWQRGGLALDAIYLKGLGPAARLLGHWWSTDEIDFAMCTIGCANLQRLLHDFASEFLLTDPYEPTGQSLLLLTEPGAQHTLGLVMLCQFFKRAGWDVTVGMPVDLADFKRLFRSDWFDAVGVSISTDQHLITLERLLPALKATSLNQDMHLFVGGPRVCAGPRPAQWHGAEWIAEDAPGTVHRVSASLLHRGV